MRECNNCTFFGGDGYGCGLSNLIPPPRFHDGECDHWATDGAELIDITILRQIKSVILGNPNVTEEDYKTYSQAIDNAIKVMEWAKD